MVRRTFATLTDAAERDGPRLHRARPAAFAVAVVAAALLAALPAATQAGAELDALVQKFLDSRKGQWHDMNVPEVDGRTLHDIIVSRKYKRALEIGTSTGHSGIWIGWALSKTGGTLVTIDIDPGRQRQAVANFEAAGVAPFIDARLGDAHLIVPALEGPFDFVFSDADKEWYRNYFDALYPKLRPGGCFVTHNVTAERGGWNSEYYQYLLRVPNLETTLDRRGAGMAISYKKGS
jgi:predicted O-methyltransferase YrrM